MCLVAYRALLGVGNSRVERVRHGIQKVSTIHPKHPTLGYSLVKASWHRKRPTAVLWSLRDANQWYSIAIFFGPP